MILKMNNIVKFTDACNVSFEYEPVVKHQHWHRENLSLDRENTGNLKIEF